MISVGVDVGGTFTKAVAVALDDGRVVARSVVPTTHTHPDGVAAGIIDAVRAVVAEVGADSVQLVTHSTTQAVNALLEGDVGTVGVIGLGRRPDVDKVAKRTKLTHIDLAPGKRLHTVAEVIDVTEGVDDAAVVAAVDSAIARLASAGIDACCVAEAFAPDDDSAERYAASRVGEQLTIPVCRSGELTGIYGLELRAVTAAINASIMPIALRTAAVVEDGVNAVGIQSPVMVMRGDGGATDLTGFRRAPARTLYSGPAASVAGALRHAQVSEAIVLEVGGTSTNVAAVRRGRPTLSYVQVASHSTALRAVDVRVIGVAGGSMLRLRRRRGSRVPVDVYGVGPRSAHIAGLPYAAFASPLELANARARLIAPKPGDPDDYCIVEADGGRFALTNTCAANALGIVEAGDYARGSRDAAQLGFAAAGALLGLAGDEVARRMLLAAGEAVCDLVSKVAHDHGLGGSPSIVAVGGGAGGLGRFAAQMLGVGAVVPIDAEIISSIGDALSLIRAVRERSVDEPSPEAVDRLVAEAEAEAIESGAAPSSIEVRVEHDAEQKVLRAIATGAIGLEAGARPGRALMSRDDVRAAMLERGFRDPMSIGAYWVAASTQQQIIVLDGFGDVVLEAEGDVIEAPDADRLRVAVAQRTRAIGPMKIPPTVWVLRGARCTELDGGDAVKSALGLAGDGSDAVVVVGRAPE